VSSGESARELRRINGEFAQVLMVVNQRDRTPPAQAYALYEEASQALEKLITKSGKTR